MKLQRSALVDRISEPQYTGNVAAALTTCERPHMAYLDVTTDLEIWKPIAGYEGMYEVSSLGRVKSIDRRVRTAFAPRVSRGAVMAGCAGDERHYANVVLSKGGRSISYMVHRLVLETFVGAPPDDMECRHLNGDRKDNRLANLCWGTRRENMADNVAHGKTTRGSRNGMARLGEDDVRAIRERAKTGDTHEAIARDYGVARTAITRIANYTRWGHVK